MERKRRVGTRNRTLTVTETIHRPAETELVGPRPVDRPETEISADPGQAHSSLIRRGAVAAAGAGRRCLGVVDMTHRGGEQHQRVSPRNAHTAAATGGDAVVASCMLCSRASSAGSCARRWQVAGRLLLRAEAGAGVAGDV
eukprot:6324389-Prymnesium_polylepis.1